jgi:outer membrane protein assembly factor BamB
LKKTWFIVSAILIIIVASVAVLLYDKPSTQNNKPDEPDTNGLIWNRDIPNFATGLTSKNNRVYTIDIGGNIRCYESQTGELVWDESIGGYFCRGVIASNNMVYGGKSGVHVGAVKASSGEYQWEVGTFYDSGWSKQPPANITVLEDRLYVTGGSFSVYEANTGELLWVNKGIQFDPSANVTHPGWIRGWPFEGNKLFAEGGVIREGYFVYRLNPDNGNVIWSNPIDTLLRGTPIIFENQVIMQNGTEEKTTIFSLDENSGELVWTQNIDAKTFQPKLINGLLIFGASDNSFYAIHAHNGTLVWNSLVDSQNITALVNSDNPLQGLPVQVDSENYNVIGSFAVSTQTRIDETHATDEYWGMLCSLNLQDGEVYWTKYFNGNGNIANDVWVYDFASTKSNVYLATISDLWIFDHNLISPVTLEGKVFVTGDLYLMSYD